MNRIDHWINKGQAQSNGMKEFDSDTLNGAPFSADTVAKTADELAALKASQETAKATLHSLTKQVASKADVLRDTVRRNVAFFTGKLGRKDPRLPKVGGRVYVHHGGKPRKPAHEKTNHDGTSSDGKAATGTTSTK